MNLKYIFPLLFLLFVGCSDLDDSSLPIENSTPILVKKIITKKNDNTITKITEFEYSGNKIVKSSDLIDGDFVFYTYEGELISNIKIKDINNNVKFEHLFSYQNNKLIESMFKDFNQNICEKRLYTHNSNNVSFVYYKGDLITQNILFKSGTITLQNEEVTSLDIQNFENSSTTIINRNYDNKNNPQKNIIGFDKLNIELDRVGGCFQNMNSDQVIYNNTSYFINNYIYEYNENNYPIKVIISGSGLDLKMEYYY